MLTIRILYYIVILLGIACPVTTCKATELSQAIDRLVERGFEDPEHAIEQLRVLQARTVNTPDNQRAFLVGYGLIAADHHHAQQTASIGKELRDLKGVDSAIAAADASLVAANFEFEGMQEEKINKSARSALEGYQPYCESEDHSAKMQCDRWNWFNALLFCAYGAFGERNSAAAAIYLGKALQAAREAGSRSAEIRATAILATLAQTDGDTQLAGRLIAKASELANLTQEPALKAYVKTSEAEVLAGQEKFEASLAAYREAIDLARKAGLQRREAQVQLSLSGVELELNHPAEALAAVDHTLGFLALHNEPGLDRQRLHDEAIALLALGHISEGKEKVGQALHRFERESGSNAMIGALRDFGRALERAGQRAEALDLYAREQALLRSKNDGRYEREMHDVQERIRLQEERLQHVRLVRWSSAAAGCLLLAFVVGLMARRQAHQNEGLIERNALLAGQVGKDVLTGLANRSQLEQYVSRQSREFSGAMFLVDIDHFKRINDVNGHAVGDVVLVEIARRLKAILRESDFVARWGGEEFVVIVKNGTSDANALAQRLLHAFVASPVITDSLAIPISASIGFAEFPLLTGESKNSFGEAFSLVDAAMYYSKNSGRNRATRLVSVEHAVVKDLAAHPAQLGDLAKDGLASVEVFRPRSQPDLRLVGNS